MAQAQRPKETEGEQLIRQIRELIERVRRLDLTDTQRDQLRRILDEGARGVPAPATQPSGPAQSSPQSQARPAPRRTEQFVYDVTVGTRTYRVALPEPLPTLRGGGVDMKVAERQLHDLLLNNRLVTREGHNDPSRPPTPLAQVTMNGAGQPAQRFNQGSPNQRLDMFRDDYLKLTFQGGNYVESGEIRIAEAPHNTARRN